VVHGGCVARAGHVQAGQDEHRHGVRSQPRAVADAHALLGLALRSDRDVTPVKLMRADGTMKEG
jgi:hypothetical protein